MLGESTFTKYLWVKSWMNLGMNSLHFNWYYWIVIDWIKDQDDLWSSGKYCDGNLDWCALV